MKSGSFYLLLIMLGMVGSLSNISMLTLINHVLTGKALTKGNHDWAIYIVVLIVSFVANLISKRFLTRSANAIMYDREFTFIQKIRHASLDSFEKLGSGRVFALLGDIQAIARVPHLFISLMIAAMVVLYGIGYLFMTTPWGGLLVCLLTIILFFIHVFRNKSIEKDMNEMRDSQETYLGYLTELLYGFKQIRISRLRDASIFEKYIIPNRDTSKRLADNVAWESAINELLGSLSWYLVLGVVIFILPPVLKISLSQVAVFVTTVLFMIASVSQLVMFLHSYASIKIAIDRIDKAEQLLNVDPVPADEARSAAFGSIRLENVRYKYKGDAKNSFAMVIDEVTINKGEVVFIAGGNGSGKTTFINVLLGLYKPDAGKILVDDHEMEWEKFSSLANNMSVVFANHFLFKNNYDGHDLSENNGKLGELTSLVNLDGVVELSSKNNWIKTDLSRGQQKRLALLLALLEDKPFIILDEWASEQDPYNRHYFYTRWLDAVKEMGKTVIAISHDDDYYHMADRVIKFNYGRIVSDECKVVPAI
jgi:cyclic peptide transporter